MRAYAADAFEGINLSVAMTSEFDGRLAQHLDKGRFQEDLTFAYWRPSRGASRYTAVLAELVLPEAGDRILQGNVAFTGAYVDRVLDARPAGCGVALLHSHLGPGWQDMSDDDIVAERDRLAGVVGGSSELPLVGLTRGTDGAWSARFWLRTGRREFTRRWAATVRSVGPSLRLSYHPQLLPKPPTPPSLVATVSVWGHDAQADLARAHVGVVGVGSVGSIVAEGLARTGVQRITVIDQDVIEWRNLDRTLGAEPTDAEQKVPKVELSRRLLARSHTAQSFALDAVKESVVTPPGLEAALACDVLISCVDRPWPRHVLNAAAYAHLIPVIDGGILARVSPAGRLLHVDWRIHTAGPGQACLYCLGALARSDVGLDRDGKLDDPDYLQGLSPEERERYNRRNVFAFSLSVASHELLQLVGLVTGNERVGGIGPQTYHAFPGELEVVPRATCDAECDLPSVLASASTQLLGQ